MQECGVGGYFDYFVFGQCLLYVMQCGIVVYVLYDQFGDYWVVEWGDCIVLFDVGVYVYVCVVGW